jgi:microcystin-dependent protein
MDLSEISRARKPPPAPTQQALTQAPGAQLQAGPQPPPTPWVKHGTYISYPRGVAIGQSYNMGDGTLNAQAIYINGKTVTSMVEAPMDGTTYGRANGTWMRTPSYAANADIDGKSPSPTAVVPSSGLRSVVGGQLATLATVNKSGLIPAINELNVTIKAVAGGMELWGEFNAADGTITWNTISGQSDPADLPPPDPAMDGVYLVCSQGGSVPPGGAVVEAYLAGDELLCDGDRWAHIEINSGTVYASTVVTSPAVLGQANVQASLAALQTYADSMDAGIVGVAPTQIIQSLRSTTPNTAPAAGERSPGELWVNFPDGQIGSVDEAQNPLPLVGVRFFSAQTNYVIGDHVVYAGALYRAIAPVIPAAFDPAQWTLAGGAVTVADVPPDNPQPGNLWFDGIGAQLYIWVNDGTSQQWVIAINQPPPSGLVPEAPTDGAVYGRSDLSWRPALALSGGTMGGELVLAGDPVQPLDACTMRHADTKLSLAGGVMTGPITLAADPVQALQPSTKAYADTKLALAGGTLTGPVIAAGPPTTALGLANKGYVDNAVPVGTIAMWGGGAAPPNWLMCDGTVYPNANIPLLAPILANRFPGGVAGTSNAVPNLVKKFPFGAGGGYATPGQEGGAMTVALDISMLPPHAHAVSDGGHAHGVNDPGHAHNLADPGHNHAFQDPQHTHGLSDPGHAHGVSDPGHAHTVQNQGWNAPAGPGPTNIPWSGGAGSSGSGTGLGIYGAGVGLSVNYGTTRGYNSASGVGLGVYGAGTGIWLAVAGTGITVQNTGSGAAHDNMPPWLGINFIIKYQ